MLGILNYIFPHRCVKCTKILSDAAMPLCFGCYQQMPFSHYKLDNENPAYDKISEFAEIKNASSLLLYGQQNAVQKLVMANKYYNLPRIGLFLAEFALRELQQHDFDIITCVPSHIRTIRKRGYNQVEKFATKIAKGLEVEFNPTLIKRIKRRDSQTHKNREGRYKSLENTFEVSDEIKKYDKLLLLDDVLTTGSTLGHCCQEILVKKQIEISVYTMAKVF